MAAFFRGINLLLGAVTNKCPLQVSECKSVTVDHHVAARVKLIENSVEGVTIDLGFRGGDQLVYDLKCRQKQVPYAIATSNGLYVRIQKKKYDMVWHVVNLTVDEFESLNCKKLAQLKTYKVPDQKKVHDKINEQAQACSNDKDNSDCQEFSARLFLLPDTKFSEAMLNGKYRDAYFQIQTSVSALTLKQREQLKTARVAVFKCGRKQAIAWVGLLNKPNRVLVITKMFLRSDPPEGAKSLAELKKVNWDNKCKKNFIH